MTWKPPESMTPRQAEKEAFKQAVLFEEKCLMCAEPTAMKFEELAEKWFEEYARLNLRNTSFARMKQLTKRVYPAIGYMKVNKITARHIQQAIAAVLDFSKKKRNKFGDSGLQGMAS